MAVVKKIYAGALAYIRRSKVLTSAAQWTYLKLSLQKGPGCQNPALVGSTSDPRLPKVAFICDEMTWQDFQGCCNAVFLHPKTWKQQLEMQKPELLFCESAWSGIEEFPNVWRGRIYRDRRVSFENRDVLLKILACCREMGIPTVFWNKEDPAYFAHPVHDFTDTALLFDHVFTTAQECIGAYEKRGHSSVHLLPFGVNTRMFHPEPESRKKNAVLFAGSWFGDLPARCRQQEKLLDYCLDQGWELDIYDRYSQAPEAKFRFPEKYAPYIHQAVPFTKMPEICRQYAYAVNVNTVVDSPTMLSRRVLQLAASGCTIISNETMGFDALQDCLTIYRDTANGLVFAQPIPGAMQQHSTENRFWFVLEKTGIPVKRQGA